VGVIPRVARVVGARGFSNDLQRFTIASRLAAPRLSK